MPWVWPYKDKKTKKKKKKKKERERERERKFFTTQEKFKNLPFLLWPHLKHMEVSQQGVELELQLPVYATATATPDLSCICGLYHSLWQSWILNPLSKARDCTHILMETALGS